MSTSRKNTFYISYGRYSTSVPKLMLIQGI